MTDFINKGKPSWFKAEIKTFSANLTNGNFLSICLKVFSVEIFKIPSLGPLKTHNSFIIADRLITSSEYHNEEIKLLKSNFFVNQF